jgi:hypothetical protein
VKMITCGYKHMHFLATFSSIARNILVAKGGLGAT